MMRQLFFLSLLLLGYSQAVAQENAKADDWNEFFVGDWTRESTILLNDATTKQTSEWTCKRAAGGAAIFSTGKTSEGDEWVDIFGWDSYHENIHEYGKMSTGDSWTIHFKVVNANNLRGDAMGALPDGRKGKGYCTIERTGDDSYVAEFALKLNDGSTFNVSDTNTRRRATHGIPDEALAALKYFVGNWESTTFLNGKMIGTNTGERKWVPGGYAVTMTTVGKENGVELHGAGISGWDANGKQMVESWYTSEGLSATVRYPLGKRKDGEWHGTTSVTFGDGASHEGTCILKTESDGWVWIARWKQDGKEMVRKGITRRVR